MVAGSAQLTEGAESGEARLHYRPQLDGMRAIAVYLVVAFHAGGSRFSGGFVGVDVFFVLSGYLVTQLLLRDIRGERRIRFARFYSRRYRRLLPASFVALVVTAAVFAAIAAPAEVTDGLSSIKAAFLYVANWFFISKSRDYFANSLDASPVVHFWSLAIEEQFYLVWPLLLGGLFVATRRVGRAQWHTIRVAVAIGGVASLLAAVLVARTDINRAYYGTDTRAYQLLAGAFLALTPQIFTFARRHERELRGVAVAAVVALLVTASSVVDVGPITRGAIVTAITCVLIVSIESATGGLVRNGLSRPPIVYLGRVSYGTYLWHWPVIFVALRRFDISSLSMFFVAAGIATGLASLSYEILEMPVRVSKALDRYRVPVVVFGLVVSIAGALVIAPAILDDPQSHETTVTPSGSAATTSGLASAVDWRAASRDYPKFPDCLDKPPSTCTIVKGGSPHLLLMGDSQAGMLVSAFTAIAKREGATLSVAIHNGCPWQRGLVVFGYAYSCREHNADYYDRVIPALDPDVVVLIERTFEDPGSPLPLSTPEGLQRPGSATFLAAVRSATEESVKRLRDDGRKVVMIEPTPYPSKADDPTTCLSNAKFVDECRYVAFPSPMPTERMYRQLAKRDDSVWSLDIDRLVCPYLPVCDPVIDGMVVKIDAGHITSHYAVKISPEIEAYLKQNAIL